MWAPVLGRRIYSVICVFDLIFVLQLQEAFAKGLLKPGLNEEIERIEKNYVNNVADMKVKLKDIQLKLPWIETLDLVTAVAPMAPDVALQMQETAQRRKYVNLMFRAVHLRVSLICLNPVAFDDE